MGGDSVGRTPSVSPNDVHGYAVVRFRIRLTVRSFDLLRGKHSAPASESVHLGAVCLPLPSPMPALRPNSFVDRQQHREVGGRAPARRLIRHFRRNPGSGWCAQLVVFAAALSCGGSGGDSITDPKPTRAAVASVMISRDTATLLPSATVQLAATVKDATGEPLSRDIVWTASDTSKVSVSPSGLVTAIRTGRTVVTANSESHSASATITVLDGGFVSADGAVLSVHGGVVQLVVPSGAVNTPTGLFASASTDTTVDARVVRGTSFDFGPSGTIFAKPVPLTVRYDASVLPSGANEMALQLYVRGKAAWQVVDGSVVDVQAKTVTGSITHFSTYAILVSGAVATVTVGPAGQTSGDSVVSAVAGSQLQLSATPKDIDGNSLTGHVIAWSTSDSTVSTVSPTGILSVLKAGTATITATSEGKSGSLRITGNLASVASIKLSGMWPFAANATSRFSAELRDANGSVLTDRVISWASSAPSVATTAQDGTLTGVAAGTTTITATSEGISASVVITVTAAPAAAKLILLTPPPSVVHSRVPFPASTVVALADSSGSVVREAGRIVTISFSRPRDILTGTLSVTTGPDGRATFSDLVLTGTVGQFNLDFTCAGLTSVSSLLALSPGAPAIMYAYSFTDLEANPGKSIGAPHVEVQDADSNPVFGVPVTFVPTPPNGTSVTGAATTLTNAFGIAQIADWVAGPTVGVDSLIATAAGVPDSPVVFVVNIVPPYKILSIVAGDRQIALAGKSVAVNPSVKLMAEPEDQPVVGATVTFSVTAGGGSISAASTTTDVAGIATAGAWTLGASGGTNTLGVTSPIATNGVIAFTATSVEPIVLRQLAVGSYWTCGISPTNVAYCWGANSYGQLGDGSTSDRMKPVPVASSLAFSSISAAAGDAGHTCAVTTAGAGYCWGRNNAGQLGDGTTTASSIPVAVAGGLTFQSISAGYDHSCGVTTTGEAYCWGNNDHKALGIGLLPEQSSIPVRVNGGISFRNISAGYLHTCAVATDGTGYCWGSDLGSGAMGQGDRMVQLLVDPTPLMGGVSFQTISTATTHTCGISTTSIAYCWGDNTFGQLGAGSSAGYKSGFPLAVGGGMAFTVIQAGESHTCGVAAAGGAYCWGLATRGAVGAAAPVASTYSSPTSVAGGDQLITVSAGYTHTCGATVQAVYCWGTNEHGQLGDESLSNHNQMVPVHKP
jgi:alpha-tubulin suppressor-like RCC1 family protein